MPIRLSVLGSLTFSVPALAFAQIHVSRNRELQYFGDAASAAAGSSKVPLRTRAVMEISRGYESLAGENAWNAKMTGATEIFQPYHNTRLAVEFGAELTANTFTGSDLNPRGIIIEPVLTLAQRAWNGEWQLSLFHRCRHDIDNLDKRDDRPGATDTSHVKRVISLSGLRLGVTSPRLELTTNLAARAFGSAESYLTGYETRGDRPLSPPHWHDARGALVVGGEMEESLHPRAALYVRGSITAVRFVKSSAGVQTTKDGETGIRVSGARGNADFFVHVSRAFDDGSVLAPGSATAVFLGLRWGDRGLF